MTTGAPDQPRNPIGRFTAVRRAEADPVDLQPPTLLRCPDCGERFSDPHEADLHVGECDPDDLYDVEMMAASSDD